MQLQPHWAAQAACGHTALLAGVQLPNVKPSEPHALQSRCCRCLQRGLLRPKYWQRGGALMTVRLKQRWPASRNMPHHETRNISNIKGLCSRRRDERQEAQGRPAFHFPTFLPVWQHCGADPSAHIPLCLQAVCWKRLRGCLALGAAAPAPLPGMHPGGCKANTSMHLHRIRCECSMHG